MEKGSRSLSIKTSGKPKNRFKIGQIVDAEIVGGKDNNLLVNIDGTIYEALTSQRITEKKIKLLVKQLTPQLVLKIVSPENRKVEFKKLNQQFIVEDERRTILEALKTIENALKSNDRLKVIKGIAKLNTISLPEETKSVLERVEKQLIKERLFDKDLLNNLYKELEKRLYTQDLRKLTIIFKNMLKTIKTDRNDRENHYIKVPLIISSKSEELYIKKEPNSLSLILKTSDSGIVQIEATLYNTLSITMFFSKPSLYKHILSKGEELKKLLGGIDLSLNLMNGEPIFIEKQLNIKI